MKLNYSTSLATLLYIHMMLIHLSSQQQQQQASSDQSQDPNYYEISDENKKVIIEQVKKNLLKVLGLKEEPKKPRHTAYVPHAMLEDYRKVRESVRESIPDDRDFYGKINIDDLDDTSSENFWNAVHNKYGSYDVEVDMGRPEGTAERFHFKGDATQIGYTGIQSDPEDVPSNIEPMLPPIHRSRQGKKQFISVHMRFNLSQEIYTHPMNADELRGAELRLHREPIPECELNECDRKPVPFFSEIRNSSEQSFETAGPKNDTDDEQNQHTRHKLIYKPRYQRIYILQISGYDQHNVPMTTVFTSSRIDTRQTTPLVFNIFPIIKEWLLNPSKNYGIIVRVTNDDEEIEKLERQADRSNEKNPTNASSENTFNPQVVKVAEHVRLKRAFRDFSESDEIWLTKKPSLLIYTSSPDTTRYHVKRDHSGDTEQYQSDEPDASISEHLSNNNPVQQSNQTSQLDGQAGQTISKLKIASSRHRSFNDGNNSAISRRDSRQVNRNSGIRSPTSSTSQRNRHKGKASPRSVDKCSKRSLSINFEEVGWSSWIIAPRGYNASYCAGDCSFPMSDHLNATNHAIIQAIFHSVGRVIPRSCCAPTKLGKMTLLYQLDGVVQMRYYEDMIVESCGCL